MQHIYVNFKRFDVPAAMGGVNRIADPSEYASYIVKEVGPKLASYSGKAEFVHFYPESCLIEAVKAASILLYNHIRKRKRKVKYWANMPKITVWACGSAETVLKIAGRTPMRNLQSTN